MRSVTKVKVMLGRLVPSYNSANKDLNYMTSEATKYKGTILF